MDNIPTEMDKRWLKQLFGYEGQITDMYISRKQRRTNSNTFVFVRFVKEEAAQRAMQKMDGMEIRGCKLAVSLAKFRRNFESSKKVGVQTEEQSLRWRKKENTGNRVDDRSFKDVVAGRLQMNSQPRECQR